MVRIVLIGVAAAVLSVWVKGIKAEYALWITLLAGLFLGSFALAKLETIVKELQFLSEAFGSYSSYFKLLIKMIGITYLAEFSANLCRDAGANTLASQIELLGKLSILVLCVPILRTLLETIEYFLGG